jgi:CHASE3 domain sensor protein
MESNWTFGRKLALGFAVPTLVLLVVGFFGNQSIERLIANDVLVDQSSQMRLRLEQLLRAVTEAEASARGFVITGREDYLEPLKAAQGEIVERLGDARSLAADNPAQLRRLEQLQPLVDEKLGQVLASIEDRRTKGAEAGLAAVQEGTGRRLMDSIRRGVAEIDADEKTRLAERNKEAQASAGVAQSIIFWGSGLGLLFVVAVAWLISRSLTQQVGSAVRHIQSSSAELQSAANQQATGAREQATAMNEITTPISELLATSRQISDRAPRVSAIAETTAGAARAGDLTVEKGRDAVAGIRHQVDLIVSHMLELGKKSQQIGGVLDIVSELAEQTNILAINATIEAAGAGDAGKRFAVVADEIRKLADRVGGSTKEIRSLVEEVRGAVNTTVMTTEMGSKAVEAGTRQFNEVTQAFKQISAQVLTANEAAREIGLSTKQQSTAVEQVNMAITNVAQATKESEISTGQTLQTASELSALSRDLMRIVQPDDAAAPPQA